MAQDAAKASEKAKDKAEAHILKEHLENQLNAHVKPSARKRRKRRDGFALKV